MSSISLLRLATRKPASSVTRIAQTSRRLPVLVGALPVIVTSSTFSTSARRLADKDGQEAADHHEESFEEFTAR